MNREQRKLANRLIKEGKSVSEVARTFSVHPATLYRILAPGFLIALPDSAHLRSVRPCVAVLINW
jgi:transposase-like protein